MGWRATTNMRLCVCLLASVLLHETVPQSVVPQRQAGDVISPCKDPGVPYTLQKYSNASGRYREIVVSIPPLGGSFSSPLPFSSNGDNTEITCGVILPARPHRPGDALPTIMAFSGGPQQLFNWNDWAGSEILRRPFDRQRIW